LDFFKYKKIERFGDKYHMPQFLDRPEDEIYWEEKIDGANFRFYVTDERNVLFGSHNRLIDDANADSHWSKCISFISSCLSGKDLSQYVDMIFFGECCIPHSLQYDWAIIPPFIGYDIICNGIYISYEDKVKIFEELGLPVVPLLKITTAAEIQVNGLIDSDVPQSVFGNVKAEGIVLKNYRTQTFLKFVNPQFKEVNKRVFGSTDRPKTDNEIFCKKYVTNPRIYKKVQELEYEEGLPLAMPMMQFLPKNVWNDIVMECGTEILNQNWVLDLKQCRKMVAARSKAVLEQLIATDYVLNCS
jgi:hypothetical protein